MGEEVLSAVHPVPDKDGKRPPPRPCPQCEGTGRVGGMPSPDDGPDAPKKEDSAVARQAAAKATQVITDLDKTGSIATPKMPRWWPRNVLMRCSRRATWRGGRCEGEKPMTRRCIKETVERRTATQDPRLAPHRDLRGSICGVRRLRARNAERNLGLCGGLPMPSGRQLVTVRRSHVVWAPST